MIIWKEGAGKEEKEKSTEKEYNIVYSAIHMKTHINRIIAHILNFVESLNIKHLIIIFETSVLSGYLNVYQCAT